MFKLKDKKIIKIVCSYFCIYSKIGLKRPDKKKTNCSLMQVKSIAILLTFIKLQFVIKIFVLSSFEWPLKTGLLYMDLCKSLLTHLHHSQLV